MNYIGFLRETPEKQPRDAPAEVIDLEAYRKTRGLPPARVTALMRLLQPREEAPK
jgi:hypothetical protein